MRYIRFLKPPRVVTEKNTLAKQQIHCLITVTSDLGDSFFPHDVELSVELLSSGEVVVWKSVKWSRSMRSLSITLPLIKSKSRSSYHVRIGVVPKIASDAYNQLCEDGAHGIVSAWSATFGPSVSDTKALKLVERRFKVSNDYEVCIWEETGESIARHLWDAGVALSCHISDLLDEHTSRATALLPLKRTGPLKVLELGTGCGIVGIAIAQVIPGSQVLLTDLAEAREIIERNLGQTKLAKGSTVAFQELDWDDDLSLSLQSSYDLVLAADCTYNPDSSPALVDTLTRLANHSPNVRVGIAMKMRHVSEEIFFDLMKDANFQKTTTLEYPLPGDVELGEEVVYLHVYQYNMRRNK